MPEPSARESEMSPSADGNGLFARVHGFAVGHRTLVCLLVLAAVIWGAWSAAHLEIKTSRTSLVAADNPYQSRLHQFFETFGHPDVPIVVIRGGDEPSRRNVVDRLSVAFERVPAFEGRVFGRTGIEQAAEVALLADPSTVTELRAGMPAGYDFESAFEGGLEGWFDMYRARVDAQLDGEAGGAREQQGADSAARRASRERASIEFVARGAKLLEDVVVRDRRWTEDGRWMDAFVGLGGLQASDAGAGSAGTAPLMRPSGVDDRGYLVSRDGNHLLMVVFPEIEEASRDELDPLVDALRSAAAGVLTELRAEGSSDVEVLLSGLPVLLQDERNSIAQGLLESTFATGLGIFVLLWLAYRTVRHTIVSLIPLGLSSIVCLGLVQLIYGHLNPITSAFMAVLMGLGIDLSVHLLARYQEEIRQGSDRDSALRRAVVHAGPGILVGTTTTALAFLTIISAEFTAFGELGVITALGLAVIFVITILLLPALLAGSSLLGAARPLPRLPGLRGILFVTRKHAVGVLAVATLLAALGISSFSAIGFNPRYFDFLPRELDSVRALDILERDGAFSPTFAYASAANLEQARQRANALRALESVGEVQSATDVLPPLRGPEGRLEALRAFAGAAKRPLVRTHAASDLAQWQAGLRTKLTALGDSLDEAEFAASQAGRTIEGLETAMSAVRALGRALDAEPDPGALGQLRAIDDRVRDVSVRAWNTALAVAQRGHYAIEDLPESMARRYVARDGSGAVALYVYPSQRIWDDGLIEKFAAEVESVDPQACGEAINIHHHMSMIVRDFQRAALWAFGLAVCVLWVNFRKFADVALAMAPVCFAWTWMLACFQGLGISFNPANIVVLPLILGIGVDGGVHMVHRVRESRAAHGGVAQLEEVIGGTGMAVAMSSMTTMVGFAGLMVADYRAMVGFGQIMVIGISCSLVASLICLPAVLSVTGRGK